MTAAEGELPQRHSNQQLIHNVEPKGSAEERLIAARAWMIRALKSGADGVDKGFYTKLCEDLREPLLHAPESASLLALRLNALSQTVGYLNERSHRALLQYLLGMSVWTYSFEVVDALLGFVVNLSTANGCFVPDCLDMLVRNFLPPSCGLPSFFDSFTRTGLMMGLTSMDKLKSEGGEHLAKKDKVLERLHSALVQTVDLVPTAAFRLQHIVVLRMPHRTSEKQWLVLYVENMLRLESSSLSSALGGQMLSLIVDRLIEIDVEIRWEDILREEDSNKVFMFHMNLDDDDILAGGEEAFAVMDASGPGCEAKQQHQQESGLRGSLPTLDEMADKMDSIMDMTLEHLQTCVENGHGDLIFDALMRSFQTTILDTYKSKFTQFLVFYLCSLSPEHCGNTFASMLCDIFESKTRPPNTRMSAAAYLASYLARAGYLPLTVVVESVRRLLEWCVSYAQLAVDRRNLSMTTADPVSHGVFYCACQAVMYVLCFRLKDLTEDSRLKRVLRTLPLQELVEHHLKPLSVCLPSVVDEFVKQASIAQLVDCREWSYTREAPAGSFGGEGRLDMFFPFDPYLLRQSDRFIRPHFIQWSMVEPPELYEEFSDEDDDFVNQTFSEPTSSWEDDSLSDIHDMAIATSIMETADHEEFRDRHGNADVVTTRGFDVGSFRSSGNGSFHSAEGLVGSFLDHMSFTPPREQMRMPARLPAVLHPSLFT